MKKWFVAILASGCTFSALSQDEASPPPPPDSSSAAIASRYYVSPMASYSLVDGDRQTDDGLGGQFAIGKQISEVLLAEVTGQYSEMDKRPGGSTQLWGVGFNALFFPTKGAAYAAFGMGYGDVSGQLGETRDYQTVLVNLGLGYLWKPFASSSVTVRTQIDWRLDAHNRNRAGQDDGNGRRNFNDAVFGLGLLIPLGRPAQSPLVPEASAEVVPVDEPAPAEIVPKEQEAAPAAAVPNCKASVEGEMLDLSQCAAGDSLVLKGVTFDFNQATLTGAATTTLDGVAEAVQARPELKFELGGHTDARGSEPYNLELSRRRATAVLDYLAGKGVAAERMSAVGYGASTPIANNDTDEGRQHNRRVELKLLP